MNTNRVILEILSNRGIKGDKNVSEFLSPKPMLTYDPFLLKNMEEGVDLILKNINSGNKICIYGDYDADGVTSVSILMEVLSNLTDNLRYYVPSRFDEGYGLNSDAITQLYEDGVKLIITVDCGIVSYDEVDHANSLGMEIMVTDHHSLGEKLPNCLVINPKQEGCNYPFKSLAGCGIAFKLSQALQRKTDIPKSVINGVLDLVALGTVGDVVPLVDENRTIVKYGMARISAGTRRGLKLLSDKTGRGGKISSEGISFGIVPHLNAAGRMEDASIGIDLFTAKDKETQDLKVDRLIELNKKRKSIQDETYKRCVDEYERAYTGYQFPIIKMDEAHEGIAGIVAGKMKDYCEKPVAIVTKEKGGYKGTTRSIEAVDIYEVLSKERDLFTKFGGHSSACGFSIDEDKLDILQENIEKTMSTLDLSKIDTSVKYDMELEADDISLELAREIELLEPFGCENEKPSFLIKKCLIDSLRYMGANDEHVRFNVILNDFLSVPCVLFNYKSVLDGVIFNGMVVDIIVNLDINRWKDTEKLQFMVNSIIVK